LRRVIFVSMYIFSSGLYRDNVKVNPSIKDYPSICWTLACKILA
jgi:hypothetical protein